MAESEPKTCKQEADSFLVLYYEGKKFREWKKFRDSRYKRNMFRM